MTVQGTATFERHHLLTPQFCTIEGCAPSRPYWAMVIRSGGTRYELDQVFALGATVAPESVELAGTEIHAGARLSLTAREHAVTREYAILSDVQEAHTIAATPFYGWTCRSVGSDRMIYVDIAQAAQGSGGYTMRVISEDSPDSASPRTIASFPSMSLRMSDAEIDFAGDEQSVHGELSIDQRDGRNGDLSSELKLSGRMEPETVSLICGRTR